MGRSNWIEWLLLLIALAAMVVAVVVYAVHFEAHPIGDPSAWSQFGDYFSGVLNPVIGIVTVVLVVITLRTTRQEAADTRRQMEGQIDHLERQAKLTEMHKRLDGVLAEWNRQLDDQAPGGFQVREKNPFTGEHSMSRRTVRDVVESLELRSSLLKLKGESANPSEFVARGWQGFNRNLVPLLSELDQYCVEYEQVAKSKHLTDFYKARVRAALTTLKIAGITPHIATARLLNEPIPQGPGSG